MQHANFFLLKIAVATPKVKNFAKITSIQPQGKGVDGEIPAMKVHFDAAAFHHGQGGGLVVELGTGSDQVKVLREVSPAKTFCLVVFKRSFQAFPVQDPLGCAEAFVRHYPPTKLPGEVFSKRHCVPFDHDVKILTG